MIILVYIIPVIMTFIIIRRFIINDDYSQWNNQNLLLTILASLIPIINWVGAVVCAFYYFIYFLFLGIEKFINTKIGIQFKNWLKQTPRI